VHDVVRPQQQVHRAPAASLCSATSSSDRPAAEAAHRPEHRRDRPSASSVPARNAPSADELRDEARGGTVIQVVRRRPLLQPTVAQHADFVGDRERLLLVVRDQQRRRAVALQDRAQLRAEPLAQLDVEARERLVEQQQPRIRRERAGERDALLLAAGQLVRPALLQAASPTSAISSRARARRSAARPVREAERDVAEHVEVREQRVVLEHHADAPPPGGVLEPGPTARLAVADDPPRIHRLEARDHAQRRGLAAAARPEQAADPARRERQLQAAQDGSPAVARAPRVQFKSHAEPPACGRVSPQSCLREPATGTRPVATIASAGQRRATPLALGRQLEHAHRERVPAERPRHQRDRHLLHHVHEHERRGGDEAGAEQRHVHAPGRRQPAAPSSRALSSSDGGCARGGPRPARGRRRGSAPRRRAAAPRPCPAGRTATLRRPRRPRSPAPRSGRRPRTNSPTASTLPGSA
jgi:hypothetical protein